MTDKKTIDWYNSNADHYVDHVRNPSDSVYHSLYEKPAMYSLLPVLNGMKVISLGCGSGEDSHYLKKVGAKKSVGIDISKEMIKYARQSYPECEFKEMDMEKLNFPDQEFDFAYSSLAIHYIETWTTFLKEVFRVLKPESRFIFSCEHPIDSAMERIETETEKRRELSAVTDKKTGKEKITGDYLSHYPIDDRNRNVTRWHKPIGEICHEIAESGFVIDEIVEPKPDKSMAETSPNDFKKLSTIPYFLIFKLRKL